MQIARLPVQYDGSFSMTTLRMPKLASNAAKVSPTGPPPAIKTGVCVGKVAI
jgi:hypothetical protein